MSGENASKALPGYRKTLTQGYYGELFNVAPAAPPDAGLPWTIGGYSDNPLITDPPNQPPPPPDRGIKHLGPCAACGVFGFSQTDAATCPNCGEMKQAVTPTYTPGTPW